MVAGLQVQGTHGLLQIDNVNLNLCIRQRANAVTVQRGSLYLLSWVQFEVDAVFPVIATVCAHGVATQLVRVGVNRWQVTLVCGGPPGTVIDWILFDAPQNAGSSYGLTLWNDAGQVVYNTSHQLFRAVQRVHTTDYSTLPGSVALPPGKIYAVVSYRWAGGSERIFSDEGAGEYLVEDRTWTFLANAQGSTLFLGTQEDYFNAFLSGGTPLGWIFERKHVDVMAIDITNY